MTDGLLENIIQLERLIQAEVAAERARAEAWRERELATLEKDLIEKQAAVEEQRQRLLTDKKAELLREGAELEATSAAWCKRLQQLEDALLCETLKRHLAIILPGGDYDHPHGKG